MRRRWRQFWLCVDLLHFYGEPATPGRIRFVWSYVGEAMDDGRVR